MGIQGLLPLLKPVQKEMHISEYAGQRVAVDGHAWLHRGAFGCATELALGKPADSYVRFFKLLVGCLLHNKVIPIIVFDGQKLPMKQYTNDARARTRMEKLEEGKRYHRMGNKEKSDKCFQQAVSITPIMVNNVIKQLDEDHVQHIVAPYEADPQLTYLVKTGQASAVITEDSDLLAFGCPRIITKMDQYGRGLAIAHQDIFTHRSLGFMQFDETMFRHMCMISGCDYLPSAKDIGLKKAFEIVRSSTDRTNIIERVRNRMTKQQREIYPEKFPKAEAAFLYQFVFDLDTRSYTRLNPLPEDINIEHLSMLGESPQDKNIPILRSNNAINFERDLLDANKENINPMLSQDEFKDFELDDSALAEVEELLIKHEKPLPITKLATLGSKSTNAHVTKPTNALATKSTNALATKSTNTLATKSTNILATKSSNILATKSRNILATKSRNILATKSTNALATKSTNVIGTKYTSNVLGKRLVNTNDLSAKSTSARHVPGHKSINWPDPFKRNNHVAKPTRQLNILPGPRRDDPDDEDAFNIDGRVTNNSFEVYRDEPNKKPTIPTVNNAAKPVNNKPSESRPSHGSTYASTSNVHGTKRGNSSHDNGAEQNHTKKLKTHTDVNNTTQSVNTTNSYAASQSSAEILHGVSTYEIATLICRAMAGDKEAKKQREAQLIKEYEYHLKQNPYNPDFSTYF